MLPLPAVHRYTPTLAVVDPPGRMVRGVAYCRALGDAAERHVRRVAYEIRTRATIQWDPRSWARCEAGDVVAATGRGTHGLSGDLLLGEHVDAGWRIRLAGPAGEATDAWDGRGTHHRIDYDSLLRQVALHERMAGEPPRCAGRRFHGGPADAERRHAGRLVRRDDDAGTLDIEGYDLTGAPSGERRWFLATLDPADWPASESLREITSFDSRTRAGALGQTIGSTDARGNERIDRHGVDGSLRAVMLRRVDGTSIAVADALTYDAAGHVVTETAGNGVVTTVDYRPHDGRLSRLHRQRPGRVLQDLAYNYDPAGNVTTCTDAVPPTEWFAGERIDAVAGYRYDSLYRLIQANGCESPLAGGGAALPDLALPGDATRRRNYVEHYAYDAAGNLLERRHVAEGGGYSQRMLIAPESNRGVIDDGMPVDWAEAFDANGNQRDLQRGQTMAWDGSDRLARVSLVARTPGMNDEERYVYAGPGDRVRKVSRRLVAGTLVTDEVRYLPGLELSVDGVTGSRTDRIVVHGARVSMEWLHEVSGTRSDDTFRYRCDDLLGSAMLELDENADIVTYEGYLPHGGTAWWAGRGQAEAARKVRRYAGKERDATGLYYVGHRYYIPWLSRWASSDPAGDADGLNRYAFVAGNPTTRKDALGLMGADVYDEVEQGVSEEANDARLIRGLWGPLWTDEPQRRRVEVLHQGLHLAHAIVRTAIHNLLAGKSAVTARIDDVLSRIYAIYPGAPDYRGSLDRARARTADHLSTVERSLLRRLQPGSDGVVWMDSAVNDDVAMVVSTDPQRRLFVNLGEVVHHDRVALADTLIHEETHFEATVGTADVRYLTFQRDAFRRNFHRTVSDVMQRYELSIDDARHYIAPARAAAATEQERDIIDAYLGGDAVYDSLGPALQRRGMLQRNADTLAVLAVTAGAEAIVHHDRRRPPVRRIRGPGQAPLHAQRPY